MHDPHPQRVYVAFEGGGAKGIGHVGALAALQDSDVGKSGALDLAGYAGTSAGAIVAALAASGWAASDLVDPAQKHSVLNILQKKGVAIPGLQAPDLLGRKGWLAIRVFVLAMRWLGMVSSAAIMVPITGALFFVALFSALGWSMLSVLAPLILLAVLMALPVLYLGWTLRLKGLARLDKMEALLNAAFDVGLNGAATGATITFGDMPKPLRIVATDLDSGQLRLFPSRPEDLNLPVAKAVTASACVPGIFAPVEIGGIRYVDGGLVSNLPAWVFDTELRMEDYSSVFAVGIGPDAYAISQNQTTPPPAPTTQGAFDDLVQLVRTAIFGAGALNTRGIPQLHSANIDVGARWVEQRPTKNGMLDFDMSWEDIRRHIVIGREVSQSGLVDAAVSHQQALTGAAEYARVAVQQFLDSYAKRYGGRPDGYPGGVRVALLDTFGTPSSGLRVRYTAGYVRDEPVERPNGDPDDRMSLPVSRSVSGVAYRRRGVYVAPGQDLPVQANLSGHEYSVLRFRTETVKKGFIAAAYLDLSQITELVGHNELVMQIDGPEPLDWIEDVLDALKTKGELAPDIGYEAFLNQIFIGFRDDTVVKLQQTIQGDLPRDLQSEPADPI
ncbi:patatin-like phospholipase family protein [Gymnodinialimonas sp. 2305UL16-5]|uniref:patatin-like phospholipase family protein n=1 Tax=Gymnodinialimonas mytili TaxID=3126503 RepID=UPI003098BFEF